MVMRAWPSRLHPTPLTRIPGKERGMQRVRLEKAYTLPSDDPLGTVPAEDIFYIAASSLLVVRDSRLAVEWTSSEILSLSQSFEV
jgi:hypothetical protein